MEDHNRLCADALSKATTPMDVRSAVAASRDLDPSVARFANPFDGNDGELWPRLTSPSVSGEGRAVGTAALPASSCRPAA